MTVYRADQRQASRSIGCYFKKSKTAKNKKKQFDTMLQELLVAGLIQKNGLSNSYSANAFDCSSSGDALLSQSREAAKKQMVGLIAEAAGTFTGAVISQQN